MACLQTALRTQEIEKKNYLYEAYIDMLWAKDLHDMHSRVQKWIKSIFGFSSLKFYLIQDGRFQAYDKEKLKNFDTKAGLVGYCAKIRRPILVSNLKMCRHYNKLVDLDTLLPVICLPLLAPGQKYFLSPNRQQGPVRADRRDANPL